MTPGEALLSVMLVAVGVGFLLWWFGQVLGLWGNMGKCGGCERKRTVPHTIDAADGRQMRLCSGCYELLWDSTHGRNRWALEVLIARHKAKALREGSIRKPKHQEEEEEQPEPEPKPKKGKK